MKKVWTLTGVLSLLALIVLAGCLMISKRLTPAEIEPQAIAYVVASGVVDPNDLTTWLWPNLHDAERLGAYVDYAYTINQLKFAHAIETDDNDYTFARKRVRANVKAARLNHDEWFAPGGNISILMGMMGLGSGLGLGGVLIKRPGDVKKPATETSPA